MKLYEYEAKQLFIEEGVLVPQGVLVKSVEQALDAVKKIKFPLVLKAQVLVGGRGKAGGIKVANDEYELRKIVSEMFSTKIKGESVNTILIEEKIDIEKELYLSITVDRSSRSPVILFSDMGGIDIEEIAERYPNKIIKCYIDPLIGMKNYHKLMITDHINLTQNVKKQITNILDILWKIFKKYDAELVEINPLVVTKNGNVIAVDAKIIIDDNALFRQLRFSKLMESERGEYNEREIAAMKANMSYVELDGNIGIIGNGAGLVMATMDVVKYFGGSPANFLDVGGGASAERMRKALEIISSHPNVKAIFINILGGITRCDEMARGIISALEEFKIKKPIVIRLIGTNEREGREILNNYGIHAFDNMEEAARKVVELVREEL